MSDDSIKALQQARARESGRKKDSVADALRALVDEQGVITVSAVARRAGVSRQFIYSHEELKNMVEVVAVRSSRTSPDRGWDAMRAGRQSTSTALAARISMQKETISALREKLEEIERERRRWLGDQLRDRMSVSVADCAELRVTCDRLASDADFLRKECEQLRRTNIVLESDLAASRQAHAEDIASHQNRQERMEDGSVHSSTGLRPVAVFKRRGPIP